MSIWEYACNRLGEDGVSAFGGVVSLWTDLRHIDICSYCNFPLKKLIDIHPHNESTYQDFNRLSMRGITAHKLKNYQSIIQSLDYSRYEVFEYYDKICPNCGWWLSFKNDIIDGKILRSYGGMAGLKKMDITNVHLPVAEVRNYLAANYDSRFDIHPRVFEQTVADVFKSLGYKVRVTAYSGDNGIDVIMDGDGDTTIGIQVKRYRNRIKIEQIRELTGALVINGVTKGIFITTSDFQSGAARTAKASGAKGYPIELYDANKFYDALKIAQINDFTSPGRVINRPALRLMDERTEDPHKRGRRFQ